MAEAYVELRRPERMQTRQGFELFIPRGYRAPLVVSLFAEGVYEPAETQLILDTLRPGDVAFDVGANIGYMTCLMARAVADGGRGVVHAFEPEPRNFGILQHNVEINGLSNVLTRSVALAKSSGERALFLSPENAGDHTLVGLSGRSKASVLCTTFDEYREECCPERQIRLVKIDVQGFELEVLSGMRRSLEHALVDRVLFELWPARLRNAGSGASDLLQNLEGLPYEGSIVSDTAGGRYESLHQVVRAGEELEAQEDLFFNILLQREGRAAAPQRHHVGTVR